MKKILYVITYAKLGGAQRYILDLAKNFKHQYDITVAVGGPVKNSTLEADLKKSDIKLVSLPHLKKAINPLAGFLAFLEIRRLILSLRPDIIHSSSFKASFLTSIVKGLIRRKFSPYFIYTPHGWAFNRTDNWFRKKYFYWTEKLTARTKDVIICINKFDYETAQASLEIDAKKLKLIHHGINTAQYKYLSREEATKKLFSFINNAKLPDQKTIIIGSIGHLEHSKGYYYLIKALHYLIIDYGYPITAIIVGEGPERKDLEERIIKFHPMDYSAINGDVSNKIILAGYVPNAAELLPAFDIYVSTSLAEGFPYTLLEAMNAGLPIVATRVEGNSNMIVDGANGLLVDLKNSRTLAAKLSELIKNHDLKQKISNQAKLDASRMYKFNHMIKQIEKVYEHQ